MLSPAAGLPAPPPFAAWKAASVINGCERRPSQGAPGHAPALLFTNQIAPVIVTVTVAIAGLLLAVLVAYLNVSVPVKLTFGSKTKLPSALIVTVPPWAVGVEVPTELCSNPVD